MPTRVLDGDKERILHEEREERGVRAPGFPAVANAYDT